MAKINTNTDSSYLLNKIAQLGPWFHNLHFESGIQTAPNHFLGDFPTVKWQQIKKSLPKNLEGLTALDIGCNGGFYSFELAKRGAEVLAIDLDPHYLKQAKWAAKMFGFDKQIRFLQMQVYDLAKLKRKFDVVLFMGVFYHLRYPTLALDIVCQKVKKMMIFQTLTMPGDEVYHEPNLDIMKRNKMLKKGWPQMAFIEERLANDPTNWWAPNHACILSLLRTCGMKVTSTPGHEIYITQPDPSLSSVATTWNQSEFLSAMGRDWKNKVGDKVRTKP